MAFIYKVTNLVNNKIYIGQTNGSRKTYKGGGKLLKAAWKKYGRQNFKFEKIVEGEFNKSLLDELEKHYIRLYNSTNSKVGYNILIGGWDGIRGVKASEETRKKLSIFQKTRIRSKEQYINISKALTGKKHSEETKRKQSLARLKKFTKEGSINHKEIIQQFSLNGDLIKEWNTSATTIAKELNVTRSSISMNLIGKHKTAHGFIFKYKQ